MHVVADNRRNDRQIVRWSGWMEGEEGGGGGAYPHSGVNYDIYFVWYEVGWRKRTPTYFK